MICRLSKFESHKQKHNKNNVTVAKYVLKVGNKNFSSTKIFLLQIIIRLKNLEF